MFRFKVQKFIKKKEKKKTEKCLDVCGFFQKMVI